MDYISNREPQLRAMLKEIGVSSIDELFSAIPAHLRVARPEMDDGISEYEGLKAMEALAAKNTFSSYDNYLGAGAYEHHVPALVAAITQRSEFLTSYTPYQPEASQGMLQCIFEYQTMLCRLTGMDVANASVYDGASACAEGVLMALRLNKGRKKVLIAGSLHPHYRRVVDLYLSNLDVELITIPYDSNGQMDETFLTPEKCAEAAVILAAYPNFFGNIEPLAPLFAKAKENGAFSLLCANPLVYGLYQSAAELGADIAVGDTQPFGIGLQFGGPYAGYMACRSEFVRQLPGRIVGESVDTEGRRGFLLTLQAREQHIRREKATSNICTNQALAALSSLIALLWYGKKGIPELALTNYQRASYLRDRLLSLSGVEPLNNSPYFNEFAIRTPTSLPGVIEKMKKNGVIPGLSLEGFFPECKNTLLIAVTETKSKAQLDHYFTTFQQAVEKHE